MWIDISDSHGPVRMDYHYVVSIARIYSDIPLPDVITKTLIWANINVLYHFCVQLTMNYELYVLHN